MQFPAIFLVLLNRPFSFSGLTVVAPGAYRFMLAGLL
jgi:hypothetical protein